VSPLFGSLALLVLAQAPAPAPVRPAPPPGLSWEEADEIAETLARIERRLASGRPASRQAIVVTERQLNSYVNLSLAAKIPPGVSGLDLRLEKDRLGVRAMLDLDRVKERLPQEGASGLLAFLGGTVPVEIRGRVPSGAGKGRIEVEQATVAGVSLPVSVLAQVVALATRCERQPRGFDLLAPFDLPWTARRVRLEPGRALVEFQP
jgi:hypothetical protein